MDAEATRTRPPHHFRERGGVVFAGSHLLLDLWDAHHLDDRDHIKKALRQMASAAGASLLQVHAHRFTLGGGVSGVAVLAESHISIHSWPERGYAALDVFMCGECDARDTVPVVRRMFRPGKLTVVEHLRGRTDGVV